MRRGTSSGRRRTGSGEIQITNPANRSSKFTPPRSGFTAEPDCAIIERGWYCGAGKNPGPSPTHLSRSHDPVDALLVIALDLLSQTEAQHRAARRLEQATQLLADVLLKQAGCDEQRAHQVRQHLNAIRDMADGERTPAAEFDRELHDWLSGSR